MSAAVSARSTICCVLLAGLLLGLGSIAALAQSSIAAEPLLDKPAPQFASQDLNGTPIDFGHFRGKVVLLNFWATWCAPCQIEMPIFAQWQRQYGPQGLQIIGISMDDDPTLARKLSAKFKLNYPVAMGDEKLGELYGGVLGLPLTYLIDRKGIVRAKFQGEISAKTIETKLHELLTQP